MPTYIPQVVNRRPAPSYKTEVIADEEELSEQSAADRSDSLVKYENAKKVIKDLDSKWGGIETSINKQRLLRRQRIDIEALRKQKLVAKGDKYIAVRTIDNNITQTLPTSVSYIKQSDRQAIFKPIGHKLSDDVVKQLEADYTDLVRYDKWEIDYIRLFDGAELLGWSWMEVLFDREKPGHVSFNHVGTEDLVFDTGTGDIQDSVLIIRRYRPTMVSFLKLARENGFDKTAVKKIKEKLRENRADTPSNNNDDNRLQTNHGRGVSLNRVFFKEGGFVFCAWQSDEYPDGWVSQPKKFWNGVKETEEDPMTLESRAVRVYESEYPYYPLVRQVTEDHEIVQTQGRGEIDQALQDTASSIYSNYVNQSRRSGIQLWSPKDPNPGREGVAPKQSQIEIAQDAMWDTPMVGYTPTPPDSQMPIVIDKLAVLNGDNTNQPAWTVNNRQNDSRKTATELNVAQQQQSQISSTKVTINAVCITRINNAGWRIIQSQAMQRMVPFLTITGAPDGNDIETISKSYVLRPAGDVDFVERQQIEMKMAADLPVLMQTPFAVPFLKDYLRLRYPSYAKNWIQEAGILQNAGDLVQMLGMMTGLVEQLAVDDFGNPEPEVAANFQQLQVAVAKAKMLMQSAATIATGPVTQQQGAGGQSNGQPGNAETDAQTVDQ